MVTSSALNEEQLELTLPDEDRMITRRGFQTQGERRKHAPLSQIDAGQRQVRTGDARYVHPSSDMPLGPTGLGETGGQVGIVHERGSNVDLYRWAHSLEVMLEDEEVDDSQVEEKVTGILELFDLQADYIFMEGGVVDENGTTHRNDYFTEMKNNIPADRTIDASTLSVSGDLNGVHANLFKEHIYELVEGHYFNGAWDAVVGKHKALSKLNQLDTNSGAGIMSHWELINGARDADNVLVDRQIRVPNYVGLPGPTSESNDLEFDINSMGNDELLLVPPHNGDFVTLYEAGTPERRGPLAERGWREVFEYKWWGGHVFNPTAGGAREDDDGDNFPDAFHIQNVSSLF